MQLQADFVAADACKESFMRPGRHDLTLPFLVSGEELVQLKRLTWMMAESFGLDRRIEAYQGVRPIGFYRWDLDCLLDVMDSALKDGAKWCPDMNATECAALASLCDRLRRAYVSTLSDRT